MILDCLRLIADDARWPVVGRSAHCSTEVASCWRATSVLNLGPLDFGFHLLAPVLSLFLSPTRRSLNL